MTYESILYDMAGHVVTITINRPDRRNSLSWAVITELREAFAQAKADADVRVVVITGAGDKAFSAGADLSGMSEGASFAELHDARGELTRVFQDVWAMGKPTIAKVRGFALAGGFGVALMCDFVVADDTAQFGTPEINVGLWPMMITVPMMRSMPPKKALELMLTGRRVSAAEAERIGFVNRVVAPGELDAAVDELAASLASKSPVIVKFGRDAFYRVWDESASDALALLHPLLTIVTQTEDSAEGLRAFAEKRDPVWTGR